MWTSTGTSVGDLHQQITMNSHMWNFFLNLGFFFCPGNVKELLHHWCTYISHASFHLIYTGAQHQSFKGLGLSIWLKDDLFTIGSSVTNETGSCVACSLRQSMWSIKENTGVFTGMEMTTKHCIRTVSRCTDTLFDIICQWLTAG